MADNARFHNKLHRRNHHSIATPNYPDSGTDPIASSEEPFQGDMVVNATVSAQNLHINTDGYVGRNVTIMGNLSVYGSDSYFETYVTATSSLSVINHGSGPAVTVWQTGGDQPVARFLDADSVEGLEGRNALLIANNGQIVINDAGPKLDRRVTICGSITASGNTEFQAGTAASYRTLAANSGKAFAPDAAAFNAGEALGDRSFAQGSSKALATLSHAEGDSCEAQGNFSHAEGDNTVASEDAAHSEGVSTLAAGYASHTEGGGSVARNDYSHAEGEGTISDGIGAHAEGNYTVAFGNYSHTEGDTVSAIGNYSHAEGYRTSSIGQHSHAEGYETISLGARSHSEGVFTFAKGIGSHTLGFLTSAIGNYSNAEGVSGISLGVYSRTEGVGTSAFGAGAHAEGFNTASEREFGHAEGGFTTVISAFGHAEGLYTIAASGAHAEGYETAALDAYTHSEGVNTQAIKYGSHAEGYQTVAGEAVQGWACHSEGLFTSAFGLGSHAEGYLTRAEGTYAHSEGMYTRALGHNSHAEGNDTVAVFDGCKTWGFQTTAWGIYSHAGGRETLTIGPASMAIGRGLTTGPDASGAFVAGDQSSSFGYASFAVGYATSAVGTFSYAAGDTTKATGSGSYAFGRLADAAHDNSYIFGGNHSHTSPIQTTRVGQFMVSAAGGAYFPGFVGIGDRSVTNQTTWNQGVDPLFSNLLFVNGGNIRVQGVDRSTAPWVSLTAASTDGQSLFDLRSESVGANYSLSIAESGNPFPGPAHFLKFFGGRTGDSQAFINVKEGDSLRFGSFSNFYGQQFKEYMRVGANGNIGIGINHPYVNGVYNAEPKEKLEVNGNVLILGSISALGEMSYLDTVVSVTSALSVVNTGTGPALTVVQNGIQPIARFIDRDGGSNANRDALFIQNNGLIGMGTNDPQARLTVNGSISSNDTSDARRILSAGTDLWSLGFGGGSGGNLTSSITTDLAVGALSALSILESGATLQHCMERLLTQVYFPTVNPFASGGMTAVINSVTISSGAQREVGETTTSFTGALNAGSWRGNLVGGVWDANAIQIAAAGAANNYLFFGEVDNLTNTLLTTAAQVNDGTNSYAINIGFNVGSQPINSKSVLQPAFGPGRAPGTMTIIGKRKLFYSNDTSASAPADTTAVRGLTGVIGSGSTWPGDGTTFNIPIYAGTKRIVIAYPTTFGTIFEIKNGLGFNVTTDFTQTTVSVDGANSLFPTNYYVYTYIAGGTFVSDETYSVIV